MYSISAYVNKNQIREWQCTRMVYKAPNESTEGTHATYVRRPHAIFGEINTAAYTRERVGQKPNKLNIAVLRTACMVAI